MKFADIGFGSSVNAARVVCVVSPDSLPVRRLVQDAKNANRAIDVSCGKKTRSVIITDSEHFILSAEEPETIIERMNAADDK
ncbi:MAG: DUF370 domain-containing protein [Clostridia bacterium]|jgi:regulator of extracellular matrix RemA (YlzA/DUF370 family)|nr:DUF370 domain-containing protein [Clostridia bacterium]MBO7549132.1 DUF370 domain-containing protein [Clostridia bacterium]MBP5238395.1 DUF370 domain-containing protein [Clostridia bacterium]MBP5656943.1 DUF370 domain-containing protein [Clostridia bacterium]MBP5755687.1 DUF370 domain-containing protein [Clostridia bacterium]